MLRSARVRILAAMILVAALGMTVAGAVTYLIQRERVLTQVDARLESTVDALRALAKGQNGETAPTDVDTYLRTAMQRVLPDADESILGIIDGSPAYLPSFGVPYELNRDTAFVAHVNEEAVAGHPVLGTYQGRWGLMRYLIVPVKIGDDPSTGLYVAAYDLDDELGQVSQTFGSFALIAGASLVVLGLVGWFVAGRTLRPVRLVREAAARASQEDLSARIPVQGHDDVSALASTFNSMLARLQRSFAAQRRLLDDVSHELRTPITIVRGHLELLDPRDPDDVAATRALTLDELDRMRVLVDDVAILAKADSPGFVRREPTDVAALTESVLAKAAVLDPRRQWSIPSAATVVASLDPARITEGWLQLAENAAKYATPGTSIRIGSAVRGDGSLALWVQDEGPGMAPDQLQRVFERFVRAEDGRGADGSGLGLSIVAAIAGAHGGTARAERVDGGTRVVIALPASEVEGSWPAS
jgi:two-component system, OmpR family, sensor kinase